MSQPRPWVQAACVCEKVLIEADSVPSLIRIVDTYSLQVPQSVGVDLTAFVALRSGKVVGEFEVGMQLTDPEGTKTPVRTWPVVFNGEEHGANLKMNFLLTNPNIGLYWFDVLWRNEVLTRIPFRIKYVERDAAPVESTETETQ